MNIAYTYIMDITKGAFSDGNTLCKNLHHFKRADPSAGLVTLLKKLVKGGRATYRWGPESK